MEKKKQATKSINCWSFFLAIIIHPMIKQDTGIHLDVFLLMYDSGPWVEALPGRGVPDV
jgi:hypothetical protein